MGLRDDIVLVVATPTTATGRDGSNMVQLPTMADIHHVRYEAHRLGATKWLHTIEGRLTLANILNFARCHDAGLPADRIPLDDLWRILREKQGYRCCYCPFRIIDDFQLDHIKSIKKGGGHTLDNIQFACPPCNQSKGSRDKPHTIRQWPRDIDHTLSDVPIEPDDPENIHTRPSIKRKQPDGSLSGYPIPPAATGQ